MSADRGEHLERCAGIVGRLVEKERRELGRDLGRIRGRCASPPRCRPTASTFAANPQDGQRTNESSPTSVGARNSSLADPPIAPDIAETIT